MLNVPARGSVLYAAVLASIGAVVVDGTGAVVIAPFEMVVVTSTAVIGAVAVGVDVDVDGPRFPSGRVSSTAASATRPRAATAPTAGRTHRRLIRRGPIVSARADMSA